MGWNGFLPFRTQIVLRAPFFPSITAVPTLWGGFLERENP
jgi:hypothetical protein